MINDTQILFSPKRIEQPSLKLLSPFPYALNEAAYLIGNYFADTRTLARAHLLKGTWITVPQHCPCTKENVQKQ